MIKNTLYSKYIKSRFGYEILETEESFVIYKINNDECFIVDAFVEKKQQGKGKELLKNLIQIALEKKCNHITASIYLDDPNSSKTLLSALHSGFKVLRSDANSLLILKTIGGI